MANNVVEIKIVVDGKEGIAQINLTDEQLKKLGGTAKQAGSDGEQGLRSMVNPLTEINQGLELAKKVFSIFSQPIQTAADLEQAKTSFEVMLGSVEAADQAIQTLKQKANATPFEFTDLQSATQLLLNFGITIQDAYPIIDQLGDISGGNAQKLQSLALVMGQVSSAGRLQGQDLLQLINAGFNPLQEISRTTGQSMADLKKQMESGAISYDMVKASMVSATSEGGRFFGMMEKQSQTLAGQMSTVSDAIGQISATIGQSMMPVVSGFVTVAGDVTSGLNAMNPALVGVLGTAGLLTAAFVTMRVTGLSAMITEGNAWIMTTGRMAIANAATAVSTGGLTAAIRLATSAVTGFFASLGPIGWAVIGITSIATVWGLVKDKTDDATKAVKSHFDAVKDLSKSQVKGALDQVNLEIEKSTTSLETARQRMLAGGAKGDYEQVLSAHMNLISQKNALLERSNELEQVSTAGVGEKFNYFKALSLEAQKQKEVNQAILDGDNTRLEKVKKELTVLQEKIKAYQALNGLKPSEDNKSVKVEEYLPEAKMLMPAERKFVTPKGGAPVIKESASDRAETAQTEIDIAKSKADSQISFEQMTTDEKIRQTEARLLVAKSGSEEEKQLAGDLTQFHLQKYNEEKAGRQAAIQEMQGYWHSFSQDLLDTSVTGAERMKRITDQMKMQFIQMIGDQVIAHTMGETEKTAATQTGAVARVATVAWEAAVSVGKTMLSIAASIWKSNLDFFSWAGPFAYPLAAAAVATELAAVKGAIKAVGFAEGGVVDRPTFAMIGEGTQPEIVTPIRTFQQVVQQDIIPKLQLNQLQSFVNQTPGIDYDRLAQAMQRVKLDPVIQVDSRKLSDANDDGSKKKNVMVS